MGFCTCLSSVIKPKSVALDMLVSFITVAFYVGGVATTGGIISIIDRTLVARKARVQPWHLNPIRFTKSTQSTFHPGRPPAKKESEYIDSRLIGIPTVNRRR